MTALLDFPISILFSSFLLLKIWVIKTGGSVLGMAATSQYLNFQFFLKLILRVIYCCRLNVFSLLGYWPHSSVPSTAPENEGLGTNSSWLLICSLWHFFCLIPIPPFPVTLSLMEPSKPLTFTFESPSCKNSCILRHRWIWIPVLQLQAVWSWGIVEPWFSYF